MTGTMRAVVAERFGSPSDLTVREVPVPEAAAGEVRIRIRSAALNPADRHGVVGRPYIARVGVGWVRPKRNIPGSDVAGTVDAVGAGVTRFELGDEVFGFTDGGGCAEYVVAPETDLVAKPAEVSFDAAAATGVAAFTALQVVRDTARALGADHVIDYSSDDFTTGSRRYDAILDNPGNRPLRACRRVLQPSGTYVVIGGSKAPVLGPIPRLIAATLLGVVSSQHFAVGLSRGTAADLAVMRSMLADGSIDPLANRTVDLDEVPAALTQLGRGHTLGKLVAHP